MKVTVKSPTRVDLAGGTLDCWPLYNFVGGSVTTNLSLSISTYVEIESRQDHTVSLNLKDLGYQKIFKDLNELLACQDSQLKLLTAHLEYWKPATGLNITCWSESPVGGGLGGSSSLSISLIKALSGLAERRLETLEMVTLASNLEASVLMAPTGTQDYFPAISEGLHIIQYGFEGPKETTYRAPVKDFSEHMFLVYTGRPHNSGMNNWQVIKKAVEGDEHTLEQLHRLNDVAFEMAEVCENQQWERIGELLEREFQARVKLSQGFHSPEIEDLKGLVKGRGAEAVKICGAGGGGCVMIWCRPEKRLALIKRVSEAGYQVLDAQPAGVT